MKNLLILVYVSSFLIACLPAKSEAVDCNGLPSNAQLEYIIEILEGREVGGDPNIFIDSITLLDGPYYTCQVQGTTDGTFQELSVIAQYNVISEDDDIYGPKLRQFETQCEYSNLITVWENVEDSGLSEVDGFDYMNSEVRQNCSSCTRYADNDYHCKACPPDCNFGLMRCTGDTSADCCVAFNNGTCSRDFDFQCSNNPCKNGSTCIGQFDDHMCICSDGFTGDDCSSDIDDCADEPCFNGTCIDRIAYYECDCFEGYEGENCTDEIDECASDPCLNGGTCIDQVAEYECMCDDRFTDENCSTEIDNCNTRICFNGATCMETTNETVCVCAYGYTGMDCEDDIDECASNNPCQNGATCMNMEPGYNCVCPGGYTGDICDTEIDNCSPNPCMNNGSCVNMEDGFMCDCENTGFEDFDCSRNIDDCVDDPCVNGTCEDMIASYSCDCFNGFEGVNCSININDCANDPCENNGTCTDAIANYTCMCIVGFTGPNCNININDCIDNACENDGTCIDGVNEYSCTCTAAYSGSNCEIELEAYEQCSRTCQQMRLFERDLCLFYCQMDVWREEMESLGVMLPDIDGMNDDSLSNDDRWRKALDDRQLYYEVWVEFAEEQELLIFDNMDNVTFGNSLVSEWKSEVSLEAREQWREYALERNDEIDFMNFKIEEITEDQTVEELSATYGNISKEWSSDFEIYKTKLK